MSDKKPSWNLQGREVWICPPDCPNRRAEPNCHNEETCERWAAHVARQKAIFAAKKERSEQHMQTTYNHRRGYEI